MLNRSLCVFLGIAVVAALCAIPHLSSRADPVVEPPRTTVIDGKVVLVRLDRDAVRHINKQIVLTDARLEVLGGITFVTGELTEPIYRNDEFLLEVYEDGRAALKWNAVEYFAVYDTIEECEKRYHVFLWDDD